MNASPKWFRPLAVIALLWNLLGCAAYLADAIQSSQAEPALYAARPSWSVAATATAVWFGAAGCVGLIMRKRWATPLLWVSLAGVVAQDVWLFVLSGEASNAGIVPFFLQGLVLIVAVGLVILSRKASAAAWLS